MSSGPGEEAVEWLVLCEPYDLAALWAYRGLRRRGLDPIAVVTTPVLASALRVQHRQTTSGARVCIELADGRVLDSAHLRGVLNRMTMPWTEHWWSHGPTDAQYAESELTAFHLGWLADLEAPVLNPPSPFGLGGALRHPVEWAVLASRTGLPVSETVVRGGTCSDDDANLIEPRHAMTAVVIGRHVCGPALPDGWADGCRALARLAGVPLLGVWVEVDPNAGPRFGGATPLPDLFAGGSALLDALAEALRRPAELVR